jgi:hypothetical protein
MRASWDHIGPLRRRHFAAWAGERRSAYRQYGQAFRRTHDAKDPGPSGCVAVGARSVAALDRITDTLFARLLADRLAATQRSRSNVVPNLH